MKYCIFPAFRCSSLSFPVWQSFRRGKEIENTTCRRVSFDISSLPGKALRTLVESRGLPSDSTCVLKVEPGKLDIKIREHGILFIS